MRPLNLPTLVVGLLSVLATAGPHTQDVSERQAANQRLVFAHFMVGIVPNRRSASDYDNDMKLAKAAGIDAFALNIGTDSYTETQLRFAYESAVNNGMKVFISFDFNWYTPSSAATTVGNLIKTFANSPAQLKVDNKVFVSSFIGDGLDVGQVRRAAGTDIFFAPNFRPDQTLNSASLDGALNWMAWDSDGANKAPKPGQTVTVAQGDAKYIQWLGQKGYIAPVSPWFFTHYGPEVPYSKNWVFPGDLLWFNRWNEILNLGPRFVEIVTWNDYGEPHYVGPLASKHTDDGNSKWVNDMPHDGWLEMAKPYIAAYKAGEKTLAKSIQADKLVYWYRPTSKGLNCDATDTTMQDAPNPWGNYFKGRPNGFETMEDSVFVVALLKKAGKVTAVSGQNSRPFDAPVGASAWKVAMGVGKQSFRLERGGQVVFSETSLRDVMDVCPCGLYNFNAFVGTVPAGTLDPLDADGLTGLKNGLKVACSARPSLPIRGSNAMATPTPTTPTVSETMGSTSTISPQSGIGGCTKVVIASAQVFPTNCLQSGQVWSGGLGGPDCCDGAKPCCR